MYLYPFLLKHEHVIDEKLETAEGTIRTFIYAKSELVKKTVLELLMKVSHVRLHEL